MENREQTEFNDALGKLNRLNQLFFDSNFFRANSNAYGWLHTLISLYAELRAYMSKEEIEWIETNRKIIAEKVNIMMNNPRNMYVSKVTPDLFEELFKWELISRESAKKGGFEMRMSEDASRALR